MNGHDKKFFTESFEQVVKAFYNTAEDADPTCSYVEDSPEVATFVQALMKNYTLGLENNSDVKSLNFDKDDEPSSNVSNGDQRDQMEVPEQEFTEVESSPPSYFSANASQTNQQYFQQEFSPISTSEREEVIPENLEVPTVDINPGPLVTIQSHGNQSSANQVFLRTWNHAHSINFEWCLENFSFYTKMVDSSKFSAENCDMVWQTYIHFSKEEKEHLELYIMTASDLQEPIEATFNLGVYNKRGQRFHQEETTTNFTNEQREHLCLRTKEPYTCSRPCGVQVIDDEVIIKGSIRFAGCCVFTQRFKEPKLLPKKLTY